jgi:hypothetical protein
VTAPGVRLAAERARFIRARSSKGDRLGGFRLPWLLGRLVALFVFSTPAQRPANCSDSSEACCRTSYFLPFQNSYDSDGYKRENQHKGEQLSTPGKSCSHLHKFGTILRFGFLNLDSGIKGFLGHTENALSRTRENIVVVGKYLRMRQWSTVITSADSRPNERTEALVSVVDQRAI